MAYAYPAAGGGGEAGLSSTSLSSPGKTHSSGISRKGSDERFDILREIKAKIEEDDNYLQFFQDRIKLEEEYIYTLKRIYARSRAVDTLHDDAFRREEKPTTRRAWDEVREYSIREIQAKEAFVGVIKEVIVKELVKLKEEQGRIRQGLKENMKHANEMYEEHAKNQLPRLKRNYWQKCQALEDHKRQENAIALQAKLLSDSSTSPTSTPLREHPNAFTLPNSLSPPTSTPTLPPMSNPAISAYPTVQLDPKEEKRQGRIRAGSASGQGQAKDVLIDIAAQSKKGFHAIRSKLGGDKGEKEEGGYAGFKEEETLQRRGTTARGDPTRGMGTLKGVRVKREADEADKAYRLGVFHLESLRIRREKLHTSAASNLAVFNDDLNKLLVKSLRVYVDNLEALAATNASATLVPRQAIEAVNLDKDMSLFRNRLKAVETQRIPPIPYHNYYVGECRSLIFGVSLTDYDFGRGDGSDHGRPPTIVEKCINEIDEKGLEAEGIYRISGRHAGVQKLIQEIERDEEKFSFDEKDDVFSISNVLKQYLRELPEPVFHFPVSERTKYTEHRETHIHSNFSALRGRLRRLPPIHQTTLQAIIEHLSRVAAKSSVNKMDAKNLAVVFNSVLFGQDQIGTEADLLSMGQGKDTLLEDLINYADLLFGSDDNASGPGIFPPGAALSRSGVISYHPVEDGPQPGSSRTKFRLLSPTKTPPPALDPPEPPVDTSLIPQQQVQEPESFAIFTPDDELDLLFDPSVIPQSLRDALGPNLHVRPLASTDLMRSHFGLLANLTDSPAIAPSVYAALFRQLKSCPETYYITVIIDKKTDQMVAHGAVIVENKFIHGGASAGHIEDIVVSPECQGGGVGKKLVIGLRDLAVGRGCYRVELHCNETKAPFYEKCGFVRKSCGMTYYRPKDEKISTVPSSQRGVSSAQAGQNAITDLNSDIGHDSGGGYDGRGEGESSTTHGSPRTTHSTSSNGVTYSFPLPRHFSQLPPQSQSEQSRQDVNAPPLPPRPANERQFSDQTITSVPPPLPARPAAGSDESSAVHSPILATSESVVNATNPVISVEEAQRAEVPAASQKVEADERAARVENNEASDVPPTPAWAVDGLGSSEREIETVNSGSLQLDTGRARDGASTPLPPGAAPPMIGIEPERIVQPRG